MKLKNKLIKWLGGYPPDDENIIKYTPTSLYCETKTYYIDEDSIEYEKSRLARELGELLQEKNCVSYTIKEHIDEIGSKIYTIRGKVYVGKINK